MKLVNPISKDPEIMSGTPVFSGSRVPARALFDYLEEGHNLEEFLDDFPTVSRELAEAAIQQSGRLLVEQCRESAA